MLLSGPTSFIIIKLDLRFSPELVKSGFEISDFLEASGQPFPKEVREVRDIIESLVAHHLRPVRLQKKTSRTTLRSQSIEPQGFPQNWAVDRPTFINEIRNFHKGVIDYQKEFLITDPRTPTPPSTGGTPISDAPKVGRTHIDVAPTSPIQRPRGLSREHSTEGVPLGRSRPVASRPKISKKDTILETAEPSLTNNPFSPLTELPRESKIQSEEPEQEPAPFSELESERRLEENEDSGLSSPFSPFPEPFTYTENMADQNAPAWLQALIAQMTAQTQNTNALLTAMTTSQVGVREGGRNGDNNNNNGRPLKASDIGKFEPESFQDSVHTQTFIELVTDAGQHYGNQQTLGALYKCLGNTTAREWYSSLSDADKEEMKGSLQSWKRILKRDFMPSAALLRIEADRECFRWNQSRTPMEYVTTKVRKLRMGEFSETDIVARIHEGLSQASDLKTAMAPLRNSTLTEYRQYLLEIQGDVKAQNEKLFRATKKPVPLTATENSNPKPFIPRNSKNFSTSREPPSPCRVCLAKGKTEKEANHWNFKCPERVSVKKEPFDRAKPKFQNKRPEVRAYATEEVSEEEDDEYTRLEKAEMAWESVYYEESHNDSEEENKAPSEAEEEPLDCNHLALGGERPKRFLSKSNGGKLFEKSFNNKELNCRSCKNSFSTSNALHSHIRESGHTKPLPKRDIGISTPEKAQEVVDLTDLQRLDLEHEDGLSPYTETLVTFRTSETDATINTGVLNTGFGASAVTEDFVKGLKEVTYEKVKRRIRGGIGGEPEIATQKAIFPVFFITTTGKKIKALAKAYVLKKMDRPILFGNDFMNQLQVSTSSYRERMTFNTVLEDGRALEVPVKTKRHKEFKKIPIRCGTNVVIPGCITIAIPIRKFQVQTGQDYYFFSNNPSAIPNSVVEAGQSHLMYANLSDNPITISKGRALGTVSSIEPKVTTSHWIEASADINMFFGFTEAITGALSVAASMQEPLMQGFTGTVGPAQNLDWLDQRYKPNYKFPLPCGITVGETNDQSYLQCDINKDLPIDSESNISETALFEKLISRHRGLFSDVPGLVREPESDWLRISVDPQLEAKMRVKSPYQCSPRDKGVIDDVFDENQRLGRMEPVPRQGSPYSLQVFVVHRTDHKGKALKSRPVVDMRPLNSMVPPDAYPIPRQDDIIRSLSGAAYISTFDVTNSFYQRLIHKSHRYRTEIVSHRGHEQFAVAPMGFKNSVQHNQKFYDKLFKGLSWRIVCVYVDDIAVFSGNFKDHLYHLEEVLSIMKDAGLTLRAKKAHVGYGSVEVLGYKVDRLGLSNTAQRVEAIKSLRFPRNLKDLEIFIGLATWNRHLVPFFSKRIAPLQDLKSSLLRKQEGKRDAYTRKTLLEPNEKIIFAFEDIKSALTMETVLHHFDPNKRLHIFIDASKSFGFGVAVYQSADGSDKKTSLRPVMYISRGLKPTEKVYWPTDLELACLVWAVEKLKMFIEQADSVIYTDHQPNPAIYKATTLSTTSPAKQNLKHQAWAIQLSAYWDRLQVVYKEGKTVQCPDGLSRLKRKLDSIEDSEDLHDRTVAEELDSYLITLIETPEAFRQGIRNGIDQDVHLSKVKRKLQELGVEENGSLRLRTSAYAISENDLWYVDPRDERLRLVVPSGTLRKEILEIAHGPAHKGIERTYDEISPAFFWPGLSKEVRNFISTCPECLRNRTLRHAEHGHLQPLRTPPEPFHTVSIDLITDLPEDERFPGGFAYDSIMTVTDRFSKMVAFVPGRKDWGAQKWATAYYLEVICAGWGIPMAMITDRDRRWLSTFWKEVFEKADTKLIATTAYHPSADGQSERTNQGLEIALRYFVDASQRRWASALPEVASHTNSTKSFATNVAPYMVIMGKTPKLGLNTVREQPLAEEFAEIRRTIQHDVHDALNLAGKAMQRAHERRHVLPDFSRGYAMLKLGSAYSLRSVRKQKLAPQRAGPFKILEVLGRGNAFRLELPQQLAGIHPVISQIHLEPCGGPDSDPYRRNIPPTPDIDAVTGETEYEVERILERRTNRGNTEYLVRWTGYGPEDDWWFQKDELARNAQHLIEEFEIANPELQRRRPGRPRQSRG